MPIGRRRPTRTRLGGNSQLTAELAAELVLCRKRMKIHDNQIAIFCGVHPDTLRNWITRGMLPGAEDPFLSFAQDYSCEAIQLEADLADQIHDCGQARDAGEGKAGDVKAPMFLLERLFPKRWNPAFQPSGGPAEALDVETVLRAATERHASFVEVIRARPPELVAALREAASEVRQMLDESEPTEALTLGSGSDPDASKPSPKDS